jgi:hypothetical protein
MQITSTATMKRFVTVAAALLLVMLTFVFGFESAVGVTLMVCTVLLWIAALGVLFELE